jgi:hypothetical protein
MFKDDTTLETVLYRYKLGLDRIQVHQQFAPPARSYLGWRDRFMFCLGKTLIALGLRMQKRCADTAPAAYHPAYPAG